jgi:hypothetical protein
VRADRGPGGVTWLAVGSESWMVGGDDVDGCEAREWYRKQSFV